MWERGNGEEQEMERKGRKWDMEKRERWRNAQTVGSRF